MAVKTSCGLVPFQTSGLRFFSLFFLFRATPVSYVELIYIVLISAIGKVLYIYSFFFFFFTFFLGLHLQHMKVPRLGVKLELQVLAYTTATATPVQAASATYAAACGNTRSLTHLVRPGIEPTSS